MHYCIHCGHQLEPRTLEGRQLEACPDCEFVLWRDPKVTTAVIVETEGGILVGRRGIEPGYGLWCLPGGFVNDDEHPAAAAARECLEEISAEVEIKQLLGVYHVAKRNAPSMVGIAYLGRLLGSAAPGAEMLEVAVFPPEGLPELAFPSHRQVIREWLRTEAVGRP